MSTFTLAISFDRLHFALIHVPNFPGSYAILLFTASDLASITSHFYSWVLFLLWLHPFIVSGVLSPVISSSILGTYRSGEFLFQCPIILPFHIVHRVLKVRIMKWFAIPFSVGHILSDLSTRTCPSGLPRRHGLVSLRSAPAATDHKGWLKQQKFIFSQF